MGLGRTYSISILSSGSFLDRHHDTEVFQLHCGKSSEYKRQGAQEQTVNRDG